MFRKTVIFAALASLAAPSAWSSVSLDEATQLGITLTPVGAEKGGNKEGTIPEYTGGIAAPADFRPGSGVRPDPFADEKPRLVISAKDVAAQADKLTEGTKELFKRYPETMRLDVYPTHRTVTFPQRILDNTMKNATGAKTDGVALDNVLPGYPFPIPKTGSEAIWNHLLRYSGLGYDGPRYDMWLVDANGVATLTAATEAFWAWPAYDPTKTSEPLNENDPYWLNKLQFVGPARRNGEALLVVNAVNPHKEPRKAWQYLTGQRRVKLLPALAPDSPSLLNGAINQFEWKLIGKKEMYIPYSNYRLTYHENAADITTPNHVNPDFVRWELHRVWVVEGTLKPGKLHAYSKRVFYLDEDSWAALASDQYDMKGQLYRSSFAFQSYSYDVQAPFSDTLAIYDFSMGVYNFAGPSKGLKYMTQLPSKTAYAPDALAGGGLR